MAINEGITLTSNLVTSHTNFQVYLQALIEEGSNNELIHFNSKKIPLKRARSKGSPRNVVCTIDFQTKPGI